MPTATAMITVTVTVTTTTSISRSSSRGDLGLGPGDRIALRAHHPGEQDRDCQVLEPHGEEEGPPYLVRWSDSGQEALYFPGPDAVVAAH